ncbi:MAG TPA: hypothetical protein VFB06_34515 [Streptosporangiaceae bacterium]|nr:hypothetical protein [Streptosporangiaceae bacterium]
MADLKMLRLPLDGVDGWECQAPKHVKPRPDMPPGVMIPPMATCLMLFINADLSDGVRMIVRCASYSCDECADLITADALRGE